MLPLGADQASDEPNSSSSSLQGSLALFAGPSIPAGDFASSTGQKSGYAKPGLTFGADGIVRFNPLIGWMTTLNYSINSVEPGTALDYYGVGIEADSWTALRLLTGPRVGGSLTSDVSLHGFVQMGLMIGTIPEIRLGGTTSRVVQNSATANAISYGAGIDVTARHFLVGFRFLAGESQFSMPAAGTAGLALGKYSQPMNVFQLLAGVTL